MDIKTKREMIALLRRARKNGRKPFAGYIKEGDGSIHVLLLDDASEFVYRQLKKHKADLLATFQNHLPDRNITKVTVVPRIDNPIAQSTLAIGGTFRVFRGESEGLPKR